MEINELKQKQIVTKDEHLMPFVLEGIALKVLVVKGGVNLVDKIRNCESSIPEMPYKLSSYTPIDIESNNIDKLTLSIDDVVF